MQTQRAQLEVWDYGWLLRKRNLITGHNAAREDAGRQLMLIGNTDLPQGATIRLFESICNEKFLYTPACLVTILPANTLMLRHS